MSAMSTIPFTRGVPSADMLPVDDLRAAAAGCVEADDRPAALAYSPGGYPPLREMDRAPGTASMPARVLLVNGSLQGVDFLAQHLFWAGRRHRGGRGSDLRPHADRASHLRRATSCRCR